MYATGCRVAPVISHIIVGKDKWFSEEDTRMNIDLSKHVLLPGQGEVITLGPPNSGKIIILVDPKNTGETRFCMLMQELDPGMAVGANH
jgi:hypothetical protein